MTAVYRGGADTELTLQFTDVTTAATTFNISRNTGLADGMYLTWVLPKIQMGLLHLRKSLVSTLVELIQQQMF